MPLTAGSSNDVMTKAIIFGEDYFDDLQAEMCERTLGEAESDRYSQEESIRSCREYEKLVAAHEKLFGTIFWGSTSFSYEARRSPEPESLVKTCDRSA